jgi:hypothetical protein
VALPRSPVNIKKRQSSHAQRSKAGGEPGDHVRAWSHTNFNPLYPYKNAPKDGKRLENQYKDSHNLVNPTLGATNPLKASVSIAWKPPTNAWNASTAPDRHDGISLSSVRSPFVERNHR